MADVLLIVALRQFWLRRIFFWQASFTNQKTGGICWQPKLAPTGLTGLTERSDRSRQCGQSGRGPTDLTGGSDRSDRSRRNLTVIRVLNRFRSVNRISCRVSLPHPINIKGHGRLRIQPNRIYQIYLSFIVFIFSLYPNFSNLDMLFFSRLHGVWGRPSWPAEARATLRALAPTESLPGERSSDHRRSARRPVWPVPLTGLTAPRRRCCKELLLAPRDLARSCVGP